MRLWVLCGPWAASLPTLIYGLGGRAEILGVVSSERAGSQREPRGMFGLHSEQRAGGRLRREASGEPCTGPGLGARLFFSRCRGDWTGVGCMGRGPMQGALQGWVRTWRAGEAWFVGVTHASLALLLLLLLLFPALLRPLLAPHRFQMWKPAGPLHSLTQGDVFMLPHLSMPSH